MPALKAFRRRWNIGSDDLVFPGIVEICVRAVWITILTVMFIMKMNELHCDNAYKIRVFYIGTIAVLGTQILLCLVMTILSARGTMVNTAPRRHVTTVLYVRLAFFVPEIAWAILGIVWTFGKGAGCPEMLLVRAGRGIVAVEWIIILTIIISVYTIFDPLGKRHMRKRSMKDYNEIWQRRCRVLCCCIWGDENKKGAFEEIADMLTKFFKYKDIVMTDVIAGLVLLHVRAHHELKRSCRSHGDKFDREHSPDGDTTGQDGENNINPRENPGESPTASVIDSRGGEGRPDVGILPEWMTLDNALYYCKYAVGSYGRHNYVRCRNCGQRCGLCSKYRCFCNPARFSSDQILGDNSCECEAAAVLQYTDIHPDDILFANFENQIYETPYIMVLDEKRKSVVIAIRGTKTFQDAITDLDAFGDPFHPKDGPEGYVHGGMLKVANNIRHQLEELHLLKRIPQDYNLVLTGHSLGGGAAVLLSMMLRPDYPDLKCFAYSPPGGLVSTSLLAYSEQFVCSLVLGNDIVPRLGLVSMDNLKYQLLNVIKSSKLPKYKILATGALAVCCGWREVDEEYYINEIKISPSTDNLFDMNEDSLRAEGIDDSRRDTSLERNSSHNPEERHENINHHMEPLNNSTHQVEPLNNSTRQVEPISREHVSVTFCEPESDTESIDSRNNLRRHKEVIEPTIRPTTYQQFHKSKMKWKRERVDRRTGLMSDPLYLPGHVMHLEEDHTTSHRKHPSYQSRWARYQEFSDIVVSPNMLHHHHGYVIRQALQQIVTEKSLGSRVADATSRMITRQPSSSVA